MVSIQTLSFNKLHNSATITQVCVCVITVKSAHHDFHPIIQEHLLCYFVEKSCHAWLKKMIFAFEILNEIYSVP